MSFAATKWARAQRLHKTPKAVLLYLAERADSKQGESCFPSQSTIAGDLGLSKRTVSYALQYLHDCGFIDRIARFRPDGSRSSDLLVVLVRDDELSYPTYAQWNSDRRPNKSPEEGGGADSAPGVVQILREGGADSAPHENKKRDSVGTTDSAASTSSPGKYEERSYEELNARARELCAKLTDEDIFRALMTSKFSKFHPQDPLYESNTAADDAIFEEARRRFLEGP